MPRMPAKRSPVHVLGGSPGKCGTFQKIDCARNPVKGLFSQEVSFDWQEVAESSDMKFMLG